MPLNVLILDDQTTYRRALSRALQDEYDPVGASTVDEVAVAAPADLAAALCDVRLDESRPENRDGLQALKWLRENRPGTIIIAMSAIDDPELPGETLRHGAHLFLPKPIRVSDLRAALARLLATPQ